MDLLVDNIGHTFGDLTVLDGIGFEVRAGEVLAVIGPSGCGKSTLIGIMGLIQPTSGRVTLLGDPPPGSLNPLTYVFQDFALLPWRTVAGNVALPLEHHGLDTAEITRRVDDVLGLMRLAEFRDAFPKQLSGGMRQRVGIARALAVEPAILFMDEPLSALDAQTRDLLMEEFIELWTRRQVTAVYVTHNLAEAARLADRVAILSRRPGRVRELVEIPIPRAERGTPAAQAELVLLADGLWRSMRDEAEAADREMIHA